MHKKLADLVRVTENDHDCVILEVKPDTSPGDLCALGFNGNEISFRVPKDPHAINVTCFSHGQNPYTIQGGARETILPTSMRRMLDMVLECVNLDYGIATSGEPPMGQTFTEMVESTTGERTVWSPREYELRRGDECCALLVNGQLVTTQENGELERWLALRGQRLFPSDAKGQESESVEVGLITRLGDRSREGARGAYGFRTDEAVHPEWTGEGLAYKSRIAFERGEGICYVPEASFRGMELIQGGGFPVDQNLASYTYEDILRVCGGDKIAASEVFARAQWEKPETLHQEWQAEAAIKERETAIDLEHGRPSSLPFAESLDGAFRSFLGKTGWQGLDAETAVEEFVRFAKQDARNASFSQLTSIAKDRAANRNAGHIEPAKKTPGWER